MIAQRRRGGSRRQFLAAACLPVVAACVGCGGGNTPNTKQLDDAGTTLLVMGGISVVVPAGWTQITGLVLALVGGGLKLYVVFAGGRREEVPLKAEELEKVQEAEAKGEKAEVTVNGVVKKQVEITEEKK